MKTKLIYQVYVGKSSKLYDHCTKSVKAYADRIGADYIVQKQPILCIKPNPFTSNRSSEAVNRLGYLPIFEKENAFDYFDVFDQVAVIDSDVYIREEAASIFDAIDPSSAFGGVIESSAPITEAYHRKILHYSNSQYSNIRLPWKTGHSGIEFFNMGVMVFNSEQVKPFLRGQTAREFLARPEFEQFIDGIGMWKWSTDQTLLNVWVKQSGMNTTQLHWKFNGLYTANTNIKDCDFIHFFLKDKLPNNGEDVDALMRGI